MTLQSDLIDRCHPVDYIAIFAGFHNSAAAAHLLLLLVLQMQQLS